MNNRNKLGQFMKSHTLFLGRKRPNISRENHYNWKGGMTIQEGYRYILKPDHPRAKSKKGYVAEHVLVMEKHLRRFVKKKEVIHHRDENKLNNNPKNLKLLKNIGEHNRLHKQIKEKR